MDDSCAVCAESLEWVAYGSCGHKEVCSTCVARLRFICNDRRCCICKTESTLIFVTKALGDYTKSINDFSIFSSEAKEGRVGSYWYHEDTQAYFDDLDHYKMIKAMCRLSCSVCDKVEELPGYGSKKKARFRNIEQLKGHLFHQHKLVMCSLCLEGRKVFVCEQKLYTKAQLKQHINTGDSEVDGTESERGGFMGHPLCEFCRSPFYGDNELYTHMSTEHYTCHICQRQHPGQYEYYKNYDDLEIHFRQEHFLCEDEACLSKKFIVFQSEAEMKRHNALEHGGRMSRSKRNAALQLPTSFRYWRSNEQDFRRGRGRTFQRDISDAELSRAIEASLGTANVDARFPDSSSSSNAPAVSNNVDVDDIDPLIQPFESLGTNSQPPSRYLQAVSHGPMNAPLEDSSFPPLSTGPGGSTTRPVNDPDGLPRNTMADKLRRKNQQKVNVLNTGQAWPAAPRSHIAPSVSSVHSRPASSAHGSSIMQGQNKSAINTRSAASSQPVQAQPSSVREPSSMASSTSSSWNITSRISHSSSAPNLVDTGSISDFPPVSTLQMRNPAASGQSTRNVEDVYTANKSMVERIRAALDNDQDKYAAFKDISGEYRQGAIDAVTYLAYADQFGLYHLVPELARLCPDPRKEKELIAVYDANQISSRKQENGWANGSKNKGKSVAVNSSSRDELANNILSTVRELQSNYGTSEEDVEQLSKDGYRASSKGKSKLVVEEPLSSSSQLLQKQKNDGGGGGSNQSSVDGDGRNKQHRKKTSKFHRVRLGDGSMSALLDLRNSDNSSEPVAEAASDEKMEPVEGLPVRGVWRNGGGHKLLSRTMKD